MVSELSRRHFVEAGSREAQHRLGGADPDGAVHLAQRAVPDASRRPKGFSLPGFVFETYNKKGLNHADGVALLNQVTP